MPFAPSARRSTIHSRRDTYHTDRRTRFAPTDAPREMRGSKQSKRAGPAPSTRRPTSASANRPPTVSWGQGTYRDGTPRNTHPDCYAVLVGVDDQLFNRLQIAWHPGLEAVADCATRGGDEDHVARCHKPCFLGVQNGIEELLDIVGAAVGTPGALVRGSVHAVPDTDRYVTIGGISGVTVGLVSAARFGHVVGNVRMQLK